MSPVPRREGREAPTHFMANIAAPSTTTIPPATSSTTDPVPNSEASISREKVTGRGLCEADNVTAKPRWSSDVSDRLLMGLALLIVMMGSVYGLAVGADTDTPGESGQIVAPSVISYPRLHAIKPTVVRVRRSAWREVRPARVAVARSGLSSRRDCCRGVDLPPQPPPPPVWLVPVYELTTWSALGTSRSTGAWALAKPTPNRRLPPITMPARPSLRVRPFKSCSSHTSHSHRTMRVSRG